MADKRIYDLDDYDTMTLMYLMGDKEGADEAVKIPMTYITGLIGINTTRSLNNANDISALELEMDDKIELADVKAAYGPLVYSAYVKWDDSAITIWANINDDGDGNNFIASMSEVDSNKLGIYFNTAMTNWKYKLEIQATANPETTTSVNRNVHIFYESSSYISLHLIDSSGNPVDDGGFWIRIYDWSSL